MKTIGRGLATWEGGRWGRAVCRIITHVVRCSTPLCCPRTPPAALPYHLGTAAGLIAVGAVLRDLRAYGRWAAEIDALPPSVPKGLLSVELRPLKARLAAIPTKVQGGSVSGWQNMHVSAVYLTADNFHPKAHFVVHGSVAAPHHPPDRRRDPLNDGPLCGRARRRPSRAA